MFKKNLKIIATLVLLGACALIIRHISDDTFDWEGFELVTIPSVKDGKLQQGYFYKTTSKDPQPLIVSLHSWRGHYASHDSIAILSKQKNINYIHPDFRGPNVTKDACLSTLAQSDIDDAIDFAIKESHVDPNYIYVVGASGGGYATLGTYMKSKHQIRGFSAWASITDLEAWYHESKPKQNNYDIDVFNCTESKGELNIANARLRSPLFMQTPNDKRAQSKVQIYAGVHDGVDGSVPFTHSIHFYNKLLSDYAVSDSLYYVTNAEIKQLKHLAKPPTDLGKVLNRPIYLKKNYGNLTLVIFEGGHEMFHRYAFNQLLRD